MELDHKVVTTNGTRTPERRKLHGRSKITNGSALLPGVDGRSPWVRRCRDLIVEHIVDLGGADNCSAAEKSIVRRASVLEVELENLEATFARAGSAEPDMLDVYARVSANLRRLLESVGLERRAKQVNDMKSYLASRQRIATVPPSTETITPEPEVVE